MGKTEVVNETTACQKPVWTDAVLFPFNIISAWTTTNSTHLMALCLGLRRWDGTRKVKLNLILLKQEAMSGSCISWAISKSAPDRRQMTTPAPHHSVVLETTRKSAGKESFVFLDCRRRKQFNLFSVTDRLVLGSRVEDHIVIYYIASTWMVPRWHLEIHWCILPCICWSTDFWVVHCCQVDCLQCFDAVG